MMAVAILTALLAGQSHIGQGSDPVWFLYSGTAKDAPEFLSSLVGAMITMTTLAISITMVVLALAAQQLGPRLIRIFMADPRTQVSLGLFISTVIYLLLVLRSVNGDTDQVPNLAVTIGTALVLTSVITLLLFVHHLARSIIADTVIEKVGARLDANAARLLPEHDESRVAGKLRRSLPVLGGAPIYLPCEGYIQAIDAQALVKTAERAKAIISLDVRAGHHIVAGSVIGKISPVAASNQALREAVAEAIFTGKERTPVQDLEFSIRQLVEIALRALSPGINDPYTAVFAIDRLTLSLSRIMRRTPAQTHWHDGNGALRLVLPVSNFSGQLDESFNMIRQYGQSSAAVLIRMAESLGELLALAEPAQRHDIERHLKMIAQAGRRHLHEREDLRALERRVRAARSRKP